MCPEAPETLFDGRVIVHQEKDGYRFAVDAVLLAGHVKPSAGDTVVDLGTGCGVIPLILSYRYPKIRIFGIELQKALADMASRNVIENRMTEQITILNRDLASLRRGDFKFAVDFVVSNPPYWKVAASRVNPNRQRAVARHEVKATLSDVIDAAARILRPAGRLVLIYPAERMTDLIARMRATTIEPYFLRPVYPRADSAAKLILVEGVKGGRQGLRVGPPLYLNGPDGNYTAEAAAMFRA